MGDDDIRADPPEVNPAGWYPDHSAPGFQRWWTGEAWSDHTRPDVQEAPPLQPNSDHSLVTSDSTGTGLASGGALTSPPRPKWFLPVVVSVGAVVVIAIGVILATSITNSVVLAQEKSEREAASEAAADAEAARLELIPDAVDRCGVSSDVVGDGGESAFLDNEGEDFGTGDLSVEDLVCVLDALDAPESVVTHMSNTRSLDGTQSDSWDEFDATWTYHPDDGLNIIVKLAQ